MKDYHLTIAFVLLFQCFHTCFAQNEIKSPLRDKNPPAHWRTSELNNQMPYNWEEGQVHVLVWEIIGHGQGRTERCVAIKLYKKQRGRRQTCSLAYLCRSLNKKKSKWRLQTLWITPDPDFRNPPAIWGYQYYHWLPSDKEIAKFLSDRAWAQAVKKYYMISPVQKTIDPKAIDGGVCRETWKRIFDREPNPKLFPELRAQNFKKNK